MTCAQPENDQAVVALPDPILIAEILSPGNQRETRLNVRTHTLIPSVQEVLILHSSAGVRVELGPIRLLR